MLKYVLGIDAGTESIRAAVFDEIGNCLGFGTSANQSIHTYPGWAEQSIRQWEISLIEAIGKAIAKSGVSPNLIEGVSADATCPTVVCLDRDGKPLRDALMWMDVLRSQHSGG